MRFIITYKVRTSTNKVVEHCDSVTADSTVDALFWAFEGCPQYTRKRIFDISITENKGE